MSDATISPVGNTPNPPDAEQAPGCNAQVTDSVTQTSVHTLALGPVIASVNAYLGQSHAQNILFANMVEQQAHYATLASSALSKELSELLSLNDGS